MIRRDKILLRDRSLVAHRLPVTRAAHPDSSVAIGTAEVLPKLVALHVRPRSDHGSVSVDAHHHIAHVDGVIAKLAALARRDRVLLSRNLSQRCDGDVILSQGALGKFGVAADAGFPGL